MTLLQDWLGISPLASRTVRTLVAGVLRTTTPQAPVRRDPKAMRRGVERC